jgi:1A family penicillin-binding protein
MSRKRKYAFFVVLTFMSLLAGATLSLAFIAYILKDLPSLSEIKDRKISQSTKIFDRTGEVLIYEISGEEKRTVVTFDQIPETVKQATLAAEDKNFYSHPAFDWKAITRAIIKNILNGKIFLLRCDGKCQGGSTITQQLVKNMFLGPEQTIIRKIKEIIVAIQLESRYSKDEILNLYLNQIPYGGNSYGIEAASQTYFGKHVWELTLGEAAVLAALPKAPTYYSPWGTHTKELEARRIYILKQMQELGFINEKDYKSAVDEKIKYRPQTTSIKAPHFVMEVQEYLNNKYGEDFVRAAGLKVITTLDTKLQELAEKVVKEGAARNTELYKAHNAALVAQDATTGQVLALVGSKDYFAEPEPKGCTPGENCRFEGNFNVATQGLRQPGSAFKPFAYLTAFIKGYTPETTIFDLPTEFSTYRDECPLTNINYFKENKRCFHPRNFDERFRGPVSFREALAQSINVPAVKVLYLAGLDDTIANAKKMGITTLEERSRYGLSLVLGGGEVKLIDMVEAYSVLAREGIKHPQTFVLKVIDSNNKVLEEWKDESKEVVSPQAAKIINNILADPSARAPLFRNSLELTVFPEHQVALKTGTTNDYRDAWVIGYTPSFVVGVWSGNNDNTPMQKSGGSILAAVPIWNAFMKEALKDIPVELFTKPEPVSVSKPILRGNYLANYEIHNILHYVDKDNPNGPLPSSPEDDPQYQNWEEPIKEWAKENLPNYDLYNRGYNLSEGSTNSQILESKPEITITNPQNGQFVDNDFEIQANISSPLQIIKLELIINDITFDQKTGQLGTSLTYSNRVPFSLIELQNSITIRVSDAFGNTDEKTVIVYKKQT